MSLQEEGCSPEGRSLHVQHALAAAPPLSGVDQRPLSRPEARHGHRHNHQISSAFGASQQAATTAHPADRTSDGGLRSPGEAFAPLECACSANVTRALPIRSAASSLCSPPPPPPPPPTCRRRQSVAAANLSPPLNCLWPQGAKARITAAFTDMADGYSEWVVDRHLVPGMFRAFVTELEPELRGREGAQVRLGQQAVRGLVPLVCLLVS